MGKLISRNDAARILGVSAQTVSNWIEKGVLNGHSVKHSGRPATMVDEDTVLAIQDDAKEIEESRKRIAKLKQLSKEEEEQFRFNRLFLERHNMSVRGSDTIFNLAESFVEYYKGILKQREYVLIKEYINGISLAEIAEQYHLTKERVRQIISKGGRRLAQCRPFAEIEDENKILKKQNEELSENYKTIAQCLKDKNKEIRELCKNMNLQDAEFVSKKISLHNEEREKIKKIHELLNKEIKDTGLSVRAKNGLINGADAHTVKQLAKMKVLDVLRIRNLGKKTFAEIKDFLVSNNLNFGTDTDKLEEKYKDMVADMLCDEIL